MKNRFFAAGLLFASISSAFAVSLPPPTAPSTGDNKAGLFAGVTYAFGAQQGLGLTLQVTSIRREDRGFASAGVSYYPTSGKVGLPVGIGYQGNKAAIMGGYDLLIKEPVLSGGYSNTKSKPIPAPAPVPNLE